MLDRAYGKLASRQERKEARKKHEPTKEWNNRKKISEEVIVHQRKLKTSQSEALIYQRGPNN